MCHGQPRYSGTLLDTSERGFEAHQKPQHIDRRPKMGDDYTEALACYLLMMMVTRLRSVLHRCTLQRCHGSAQLSCTLQAHVHAP